MSKWGWSPERDCGIWRFGAGWMRPFVAAAPWLTVALLILMVHLLGGTLTSAKGVLFDLPEASLEDGETTGLVAIVLPKAHDTMVFFDDARYMLGDAKSVAALGEHLAECMRRSGDRTLLALADRRVSCGDLMTFTSLVRKSGAEKVLFAEKKAVEAK